MTTDLRWRRGTVTALGRRWAGSVELTCVLDGPPSPTPGGSDGGPRGGAGAGAPVRALAHPPLVGEPRVGDAVLLSTAALARGLGTGGYALVVALPDRLPPDPEPSGEPDAARAAAPAAPRGHLVKARYTPGQVMVLGVDEQDSPHHEVLREADDLAGTPVVVADLHSSLPAVLAGARATREGLRAVYLMTDGGALPAWFSRTTAALREAGWLAATITTGQAFGGDLEAVTTHTGLLAAHEVLGADLVVVAQGPGNLGTGTRWGFSGVAVGEALNATAVLGGRPVAALRVSGADARERHLGISHHSLTAIGRVALAPVEVAVPDLAGPDAAAAGVAPDLAARVARQAGELGSAAAHHRLVPVDLTGLAAALRAVEEGTGVRMSTMGRGLDADPAAFLAAAAAGRLAAGPR